MTDMLFDVPECLSPKLAWLKKHGLETAFDAGWQDKSEAWSCYPKGMKGELTPHNCGLGETEEEAILSFCENIGVKHYSLP